MASASQKITLSASRDIPFDKLLLSACNVRRIKAGVSIQELADDIARRSLLQSLTVRPVLDADGQETGLYEIPAGGRRYRALELLVRQKRLAKRRADTEVMLPAGPKIAFAGGYECNDHAAIWAALDRGARQASRHGAAARRLAQGRRAHRRLLGGREEVPQVAFRPDFARHRNAAPFKRNDQLLETMPIGAVVFPGSGISDNLVDKARKLDIPILDCRKQGGAATLRSGLMQLSRHLLVRRLSGG